MPHSKDTAYLQKLIDSSDTAVIPRKNPLTGDEMWEIETPLILTSNKTVILDGAYLRLKDGVFSQMFATEWPLSTAPDETFELKKNIKLLGKNGAAIDGGVHNGLTEKTARLEGRPSILVNNFIHFRGVDGFEVSGIKMIEPRHWAMTFHHCSNGCIADIEFDCSNKAPNQDGVDLRFGCHDIVIENITGTTGDDTVALTALRWPEHPHAIKSLCPDIYNVVIRNVSTACTGGHGIIRLLCHDGIKLHDVTVENVTDRNNMLGIKNRAPIRIGDKNYAKIRPALESEMYNITVKNVTTDSPVGIKLHGDPKDFVNFVYSDIKLTSGGDVIMNTKLNPM